VYHNYDAVICYGYINTEHRMQMSVMLLADYHNVLPVYYYSPKYSMPIGNWVRVYVQSGFRSASR